MRRLPTARSSSKEEKPLSPLRTRLHEIIFEADTPAGKAFDVVLLMAIVLSVLVAMLDTVGGGHERDGAEARRAEPTHPRSFGRRHSHLPIRKCPTKDNNYKVGMLLCAFQAYTRALVADLCIKNLLSSASRKIGRPSCRGFERQGAYT
jgi:hypothetical protein